MDCVDHDLIKAKVEVIGYIDDHRPAHDGRRVASRARSLLADHIVVGHHGRIDVESSASGDTTFTVRVPRDQ